MPQEEKGVDPRSLALVIQQVRNLIGFHQLMGISSYPSSPELQGFIRNRVCRSVRHRQQSSPEATKKKRSAGASLASVNREIVDCHQCPLSRKRIGQVMGQGSDTPKIMVVGDWSRQEAFDADILFGREEDPMLWRMMEAIGLSREDVYVTNVMKCCPFEPQVARDCGRQCFVYLNREIAILRPPFLLAMGDLATALLLATTTPLVRLRGRMHNYRALENSGVRVMPTFHPRFLLQHQEMKKMVWQDLQRMQRLLHTSK